MSHEVIHVHVHNYFKCHVLYMHDYYMYLLVMVSRPVRVDPVALLSCC